MSSNDRLSKMLNKHKPFSALHSAVVKSDLEKVRTLIQSSIDVNCHDPEHNITPIFLAIVNPKDLRIIEELVSAGANVNATAMDNQLTPLIFAVILGKLEIVRFLLSNGAKIDAKDLKGNSALHEAAMRGFLEICELLIKSGLNVDIRNEQGKTPLHTAIDMGEKEAIRLLLRKGADINAGACVVEELPDEVISLGSNVTPIFLATVWNEPEIVDILIKAGADVNAKTSLDYTALFPAAQEGYTDIVKMLIAAGADPNVRSEIGRVPLHAAARKGHANIVQMLLNIEGIEVHPRAGFYGTPLDNAVINGDLAIFKLLVTHGAPIDDSLYLSLTPLHTAVLKKHESLAEDLIKNGADVHAVDCFSATPLYYACVQGCSLDLIKFLVEKGANIDARAADGMAPMPLAAINNRVDIVKYFIDQGADPDFRNRNNLTALHCAAEAGSVETVRYLVTKVAEIDAVSNILATPLHSAVYEGHYEVVEILLNKGANVNVQDASKLTPLHLSTNKGQVKIAELLINHKAVIDAKEKNGDCTPLFLAVQKNHEKLVRLLLKKGGDVNAANKSGVLPIHIATGAGNVDMVKLLLQKGAYYNVTVQTKNLSGSPLEIAKKAENETLIAILDLIEKLFSSVIKNDTCKVRECLQASVIVNASDMSGKTVFHHIVSSNESSEVTELLVKHVNELSFGKRNQVINTKTTIDKMTALHLAAENNTLPVVELLLANGAVYNAKNKSGKTPLQLTTDGKIKSLLESAEKLFEAVKEKDGLGKVTLILSNNNSAINARDADGGGTPLYWAVSMGHDDIAKHLLTVGADCCLVTNKGTTPLHIASSKGNLGMVKALVANVKNDCTKKVNDFIDTRTVSGTAAMHVASSIDVVKYLLQEGAMYDIRNGENKTALEVTRNVKVREFLQTIHQLFEAAYKGNTEVLKSLGDLDFEESRAIFKTRNEKRQTLMEVEVTKKLA